MMLAPALVQATGLVKSFALRSSAFERAVHVRALDGVDIDVARGETVAVVGESGSGKSTLGRALLMLDPPSAGSVRFDGQELTRLSDGGLRVLRRRMQMVFQDPFGSLNPRMTIREILAEPFQIHGLANSPRELAARVDELLDAVRLPRSAAGRLPRQFSGGSVSGSALRGRSRFHLILWLPMSLFQRSMYRFRHRFCGCSKTCAQRATSHTCSSHTILPLSG